MAQEKKHKGNRTLDGMNSLVNQACGYMREAWRLTIQHEDRKAGKKSVLPENLMATSGTTKIQFYGLEKLDRRLDGYLSEWRRKLKINRDQSKNG